LTQFEKYFSKMVSIIVPARNEERNISRCIDSLLRQNIALEIIVVDDASTDGTPLIVADIVRRDNRVRQVHLDGPPAGWTGKNYAVYQGFLISHGEWILFCDADTYHYPDGLAKSIAFAESNKIDCLSYSPEQECGSFWERILQPPVFELLNDWFSYTELNELRTDATAANGQYILIRRSVIEKIGTHAAVKDKILEDVELARLIKRAGYRLYFTRGTGIVRTRMYRSLVEWWIGWTKSLYLLRYRPVPAIAFATAKRVLLDVLPLAMLLAALLLSSVLPAGTTAALCGVSTIIIAFRFCHIRQMWKRDGFDTRFAVFYPIGSVMLISVMWNSVYRYRRNGTVQWKQRFYSSPVIK
jgi:chlorobactene glucosyltransferase